ncbi:hypothetical protein OG394_18595 [Kribbella sp. NBC_01245]|uniref:hypothetical protein n=1 Tax=Kribbella sp. NBC_01245 TaxID=2903578 RepID=UPI002E2BE6F2|nr:hypothetical protein [Kribbella sp. NBC_01245]
MTTHRLAVLLLGLVVLAGTTLPAAAVSSVELGYACRAQTPMGDKHFRLRENVRASAPRQILAGATFPVVVELEPGDVPAEIKGFKLRELRDLALRFRVPANSRLASARLTGGSGLGAAPYLEIANGVVTVKVPGPIAGGSRYQLPKLTLWLVAGSAGTTIETRPAGSSHDEPGLTLIARIKIPFGTVKAPAACHPDPVPILTRTRIR